MLKHHCEKVLHHLFVNCLIALGIGLAFLLPTKNTSTAQVSIANSQKFRTELYIKYI